MKKWYLALMAVCSIVFVLVLSLDVFSAQISILLCVITVFFVCLSVNIKNIILKYLCIAIFSLTLPLAILETYYVIALQKHKKIRQSAQIQKEIPEHIKAILDPNKKYTVQRSSRTIPAQDITLYDVLYTTDSRNHRITPYYPQAKVAVVLVGCSFTFGNGINDEETFAYKLGKNLGPNYQVYNLGVPGTGPHRILSELENTQIHIFKQFNKALFYYVAIDDHMRRASGSAHWDINGVFYKIKDGFAERAGTFSDILPFYRKKPIHNWVTRSSLYNKIHYRLDMLFAPYPDESSQLALQSAIMHSMQKNIKDKYANSSFRILLWPPNTDTTFKPLLKDIPHVDLKTWFPNYDSEIEKYVISYPEEVHPSAYANSIVADKLTQIVIKDAEAIKN